jgi:hypothetical protein
MNLIKYTMRIIKALFLPLSVMMVFNAFSQDTIFIQYGVFGNYAVDTLLVNSPYDQPILHGTMILPNTDNQSSASVYSLFLDKITSGKCTGDEDSGTQESTIDSIYKIDSTLFIETSIYSNCCNSFLCDISVVNKNTLNLIYYAYGMEICACNCYYKVIYHVNLFNRRYFYKTIEDLNNLKKIKAVMLNGDIKSLKDFKVYE